jgi:hypothetical protein
MGYRNDLIQRMQQDGFWNQLTGDKQAQVQGLTDQQARAYMVAWDQWDMGELGTVAKVATASLTSLLSSFGMRLVELDSTETPRLSKAGTLLAEFVQELENEGVDLNEIAHGFANLDYLGIINLRLLHKHSA